MTKILNGSRQFGKPVKKSSTEISESANKNSLLLLAQAITSATAAISTQSSRFTTRGHIHKSGRAWQRQQVGTFFGKLLSTFGKVQLPICTFGNLMVPKTRIACKVEMRNLQVLIELAASNWFQSRKELVQVTTLRCNFQKRPAIYWFHFLKSTSVLKFLCNCCGYLLTVVLATDVHNRRPSIYNRNAIAPLKK